MTLNIQAKQTILCGICGGIGSGKSFIAARFQALGAVVFDADQAGHQVLLQPRVKSELVQKWGENILQSDGELDRSAIAALVFALTAQGTRDRQFLQSISHPLIELELKQLIQQTSAEIVILDAALLFETGWNRYCDRVIYVEADESLRQRRCEERGWSITDFKLRESSQLDLLEKRKQADFVIENQGDDDQTAGQVAMTWQTLSLMVREKV